MTLAIILDTETTGFTEPEVIQIAWREFDFEGGIYAMMKKMYSPSKPIEWGALATHNILPEELEGLDPSSRAPGDVPPLHYLIGHNIDFDWKALGCLEGKRVCTQAMARALWPDLDSHKLTALIYYILGPTPSTRARIQGAHSAADDVEMCEILLRHIINVAKIDNLEDLYTFSEESRIPKVMSFGKFKGEPVSVVDRGYMNWYRKQPDTDPYLIEAFRRNGM